MLLSMTGFGRGEVRSAEGHIRVEIRSTNHKFSEVSCRMPPHLSEFEEEVRKIILKSVRRGKVTVFIASPDPAAFSSHLFLNAHLAKEVYHKIVELRRVLGLKEAERETVFREVLRYPDVIAKDTAAAPSVKFSRNLFRGVGEAAENLKKSRAREGKALEADFRRRLADMKTALKGIEKRLPILAREYRAGLEAKLKNLLPEGAAADRNRLAMETTALYLKNSDIAEEITRFKSHIEAMERALKETGEVGRKIDFIGQEMTREANTMGSKSADVAVANFVIALKSAIEKIREQAQNVE